MEIWVEIVAVPRYLVSNYGRVMNSETGRIMQPIGSTYGSIDLYQGDGTFIKEQVHILVLEAFICPRPPGYIGNHKDLNKRNNHVSNLEWVTYSENNLHSRQKGRNYQGGSRKIPVEVVESGEMFESIRECAKALGIHEQSITNVLNGHSKTGGGYTFRRA